MNTGYWHGTVIGSLQMKTIMHANSAVFLVLRGLCCLALDPCFAIPHCAHSRPTAGRKALLLPSPIKASLLCPHFGKYWLFALELK